MVSKKQIQKQLNNTIDTQTEFITKKKRLWRQIKIWNSKENNSECPQNLNLIASKSIWIQGHTKKIKNSQSSTEIIFSITFPTETKADHNNMKDLQHWSTQISKRTSAHQSLQVSNGTHTLKKQTLTNNMVLDI